MTADNQLTKDIELLPRFVDFSAEVTAFSAFDLWGTGQAEAYFATVLEQVGEATLREVLDARPQEGAGDRSSLLEQDLFGDEELGPVARSIIKLWYSGIWYQPEGRPAGRTARRPPFVVSSAAYAEGLMWRAIGAHPAGAKAPGYGSWAEPPVIEDYP